MSSSPKKEDSSTKNEKAAKIDSFVKNARAKNENADKKSKEENGRKNRSWRMQ